MEFSNLIENTLGRVADQGFMFWTATGAVALGVTLILAAGYIQFQRIRSNSRAPQAPAPAENPELVQLPAETPLDPKMNEALQKPLVWLGTSGEEGNSEELGLLLDRLRKAADRLDAFKGSSGEIPPESHESPLKESREGVDYLFRTGTA